MKKHVLAMLLDYILRVAVDIILVNKCHPPQKRLCVRDTVPLR